MPTRKRLSPAKLRGSVIELLSAADRPMHPNEIASKLGLRDPGALHDVIDTLLDDDVLVARPGRRVRLAEQAASDRGTQLDGILAAHPRGFAFLRTVGAEDNVYVAPDAIGGAMHGDAVSVRVLSRSGRGLEGEVVEIRTRGRSRVAGIVRSRGSWIEPDDGRIRGPIELTTPVEPLHAGQAAVVEITRYPETVGENPQGEVLRVLGVPGEPDVEVAKILLEHAVEEDHPPKAEAEAEAFGESIDPEEAARREDLRELPLCTIDPEDARDHDDALFASRDEHGEYTAWIAIADVSHYVVPGSALDDSARARGNSVYLPDRAVPMLPRQLSSHLCSLVEGEDRLCMCVEVTIAPDGKVLRSRAFEGVMRSHASLTYAAVARALGFTTKPDRDERAEERRHDLQVLWDLSSVLRKKRMRRGALAFDLPEARIEVDSTTRAPIDIYERRQDPGVRKAYRLVEELMLLANEAVARELAQADVPTVYRVHAAPNPDKLLRFARLCEELDIPFELDDAADPKILSKRIRKIEGHEKARVLYLLLLRAMQQAHYDIVNIGHFGLASPAYLHFTSPIRRYPDLVVHRMVRSRARGKAPQASKALDERLREAALRSSTRERAGMEAERKVSSLYTAIYMRAHLGERFHCIVMGIGETGLYARIEEPFVEVYIPLNALGQTDYQPDEHGLRVVAERSGDRIAVGDRLHIEIEEASLLRRTVLARRVVQAPMRKPGRQEKRLARKLAARTQRGRRKGRGRGRR